MSSGQTSAIRYGIFLAISVALTNVSRADLLISPNTGTQLTGGTRQNDQGDDVFFANRPLGFTNSSFQFFDGTLAPMFLTDNGNLMSVSTTDFNNTSLADDSRRATFNQLPQTIAPLWYDYTNPTSRSFRMLESRQSGVFYAATWQNAPTIEEAVVHNVSHSNRSIQLALFAQSHTIGGFTFQPNDIAFSYNHVDASGTAIADGFSPTLGIASGTGQFATIPGTNAGKLTALQVTMLPDGPGEFVLFRRIANSQGNFTRYDVSFRSTAVPEPGSGLVAAVLIAAGQLFTRRREAYVQSDAS